MAGVRREDLIPAGPFRDYLNERIRFWENAVGDDTTGLAGPLRRVCDELGWTEESGTRRLFRMRHGLRGVGRNKSTRDVPTDHFSRPVVEDALHHAGVPFTDLYPELADDLEPVEGLCVVHGGRVFLDAAGLCQWCEGEREFRERLAARSRDRGYNRARKQAA